MQPHSDTICYSTDQKASMHYANGWYYLKLSGTPYEIGFQHGELLSAYITQTLHEINQLVLIRTGMDWAFFKKNALRMWESKLPAPLKQELKGIVDGVNSKADYDSRVDFEDLLAWNGYTELTDYWFPTVAYDIYQQISGASDVKAQRIQRSIDDSCSAFIATGDYTTDGKIVVGHNTFSPFPEGNYCNVIIEIQPTEGYAFKMQSQPGYIHSLTDFYVTEAGLIITETTIGGFCVYATDHTPEFIRIRNAVQFADSLDAFTTYLLDDNNGGYANTWLVGDTNTNEIMRFELGLKFHKIDKTTNGYYAGFNAPLDPRIRNFECTNSGFGDIRRHQGARQVRIPQIVEAHKGKIDLHIAKTILADHYDVYTQTETPCSRTICSHYELDAREYMSQPGRPVPFEPRGAVDGVVCSAHTAAHLGFDARYGSSCGSAFDATDYLAAHPQFDYLKDFLKDRPTQPWVPFY